MQVPQEKCLLSNPARQGIAVSIALIVIPISTPTRSLPLLFVMVRFLIFQVFDFVESEAQSVRGAGGSDSIVDGMCWPEALREHLVQLSSTVLSQSSFIELNIELIVAAKLLYKAS
jgi:hypothetical protein